MSNVKDDPFFVVRDDVNDSLEKADDLLKKYIARKNENSSEQELAELAKELRNSIRSIEWDLEDLQETVAIVEKNPQKFKLTAAEVGNRKRFISTVKEQIKSLKDNLASNTANGARQPKARPSKTAEKQSLLRGAAPSGYHSSVEEANRQFIDDTKQQQALLIRAQDEQIENIGASVKVLKNISSHIGNELDEQAVLLDDLGHEMDNTGSKMDNTMTKIAKVTKLSSDKKQWCAIGILVIVAIIIIILLSVL